MVAQRLPPGPIDPPVSHWFVCQRELFPVPAVLSRGSGPAPVHRAHMQKIRSAETSADTAL
eukprot:14301152-Alexandrium_andersonii.AAC.1